MKNRQPLRKNHKKASTKSIRLNSFKSPKSDRHKLANLLKFIWKYLISFVFILQDAFRLKFSKKSLVLAVIPLAIFAFILLHPSKAYLITKQDQSVIGAVYKPLQSKLTYDSKTQQFDYNLKALNKSSSNPAEGGNSQYIGGGDKDYAASLSSNLSKGLSIYDTTATSKQIKISLTPMFKTKTGKQTALNQLVYPLKGVDGKLVYDLKGNGLQESLLLTKKQSNNMRFSYKLNINNDLEAKMLPDGNVGIYSANPALFGNISYGSSNDQSLVAKAQENSAKTYLAFVIPAPTISQNGGSISKTKVSYELKGNNLTIVANNLDKSKFPLNIDPSVIVSSANSFLSINNEYNIKVNSSGLVQRNGLNGGSFSVTGASADTGTAFTPARENLGAVVNNGYIYIFGGDNGATTYYQDIQYAQINSAGQITGWTVSATTLPYTLTLFGYATYDGYLYLLGGQSGGIVSNVEYAQFSSSSPGSFNQFKSCPNGGTLTNSSWCSTTSLPSAEKGMGVAVYNNYIYAIGGYNGSAYSAAVQYAPIEGDGEIGAWTTTQSIPNARYETRAVAYDGYLYLLGGYNGTTYYNDVEFANINSNGSLQTGITSCPNSGTLTNGTWCSTSSFTTARANFASFTNDGYLYIFGGINGGTTYADIQQATINSGGTIGPWETSSVGLSTGTTGLAGFAYNGYAYEMGGSTNGTTTVTAAINYTAFDPVGVISEISTTTSIPNAEFSEDAFTYNGYIYIAGGLAYGLFGNTDYTNVYYAQIGSNGTLGGWTSTTALPYDIYDSTAVAYDGYAYIPGGYINGNISSTVYYTPISSNGALGSSWIAATNLPATRMFQESTVANGYLYVAGGCSTTACGAYYSTIYYALICTGNNSGIGGCTSTAGTVGTWNTSTNALPVTIAKFGFVQANGYLYVVGGESGGAEESTTYYALICTGYNSGTGGCNSTAGNVGTWASTSAIGTATESLSLLTYNGYLYEAGGDTGTNGVTTTEYAPINANGTVGTWVAGQSLGTAVTLQAAVESDGFIYLLGGANNSIQLFTTNENVVQYAQINDGGSGLTSNWLTSSNSFTTARAYAASVAYNGYLYILGGYNGSYQNDVQYAAINTSGSTGSWGSANTSGSFTTARAMFQAFAYNGYMYVVGGYSGSELNDVQYAPINSNGTLGAWSSAGSGFSTARDSFGAAIYNGYLYVLGGCSSRSGPTTCTTVQNSVQYAPINSNGTIGTWNSTTILNTAKYGLSAIAYNGYLYILGGNDGTNYHTDVQYAPINSNGTLGTWNATNSFSIPRDYQTAVAMNGFMYVLGGYNGSYQNDGEYADINSNGTLGAWSNYNTSFTTAREGLAGVAYEGNMFILGGYSGSYQGDVQYADQMAIARKAQYSYDYNLTGNALPTYLYFGATPNNSSLYLTYTTGYSGSLTMTSQSSPTTLVPSTLMPLSTPESQYLMLYINIDDSEIGVFPDSSTNTGNLSSQTLYFQAAPSARLRNGGTFTNGSFDNLDTTP